MGLYWDNGKENGNYYGTLYKGYMGLLVEGLGILEGVSGEFYGDHATGLLVSRTCHKGEGVQGAFFGYGLRGI